MKVRASRWLAVVGVALIALIGVQKLVDNSDDTAAVLPASSTSAPSGITTPSSTKPSTTTATRAVERYGLIEAVTAGLVEVEFLSSGGASGDVVEMLIRRLEDPGEVTLELTVPAGLMLSNPAAGEQDLVVLGLEGRMSGSNSYVPVDEITLAGDDWQTYLLEAYCAEAHDANPSEGGALALGGMAGPHLIAVLGALDAAGAAGDLQVIQAVVWAVTDDVTAGDLDSVGYGLGEADLALARKVIETAGLDPADFRLFSG